MANYFSLIKVFLKSIKRESSSNKRTKHIFRILLFFTILFILIPFLIICASFVYDTTIKLIDIEYESIGLKIMCYIMCIFTFIFGFTAILNELFFSTDIEKLLPLPIKPTELALSKFTTSFILESIIQIFLTIVCIISYMAALHLRIPNFLLSILQVVSLSLMPMIYSAIICLIIMHFAKYIKNKEHIKKLSTIFVFILFFGLIFFINKIKGFDFQLYLENFVNGDHRFLDIMNIIFPQVDLFTKTLTNMDVLALIKYILINAIWIIIFIGLIKLTYIDSVIDLSNKNNSSVKNSTVLLKKSKERKPIKSYIIKEFKILFRTPSFFINCIIINFIWPIIIYALYEIGTLNYDIAKIRHLLAIGDEKIKLILLLFVVGVSIIIPAMNAIAATSFSREGKNFQFIKYIPISYKTQILIKYLTSFIISFIGIFMYAIIFFFVIKLNFITMLEFILISCLCISAVTLIGIYIDSLQPKLFWDDENNALRENYNTFISMGICTLLFIIICIGSYSKLYKHLGYNFTQIFIMIFGVLLIINSVMGLINIHSTIKNINEQE